MAGPHGPPALVIVFTPRANDELLAAVTWWRTNRPNAPRLLDDEIARALQRIAAYPRSGVPVRGRDVRRVILRGSGYWLFYRIRPRLARIEIVSLWHARRG